MVWSRARTGLSVFSCRIAIFRSARAACAMRGRRVGAILQQFGPPAIERRPVRLQGDGPAELLDRLVGLALLLVDMSELGMGQERVFLEADGLLVVGGGLIETAPLESNQAAVDQEDVLESLSGVRLSRSRAS